MTVFTLARSLHSIATVVIPVIGLFSFGKKPTPNTILDKHEVSQKIRLGISDLMDADRRREGFNAVSSDISIEDLELAARIAKAMEDKK